MICKRTGDGKEMRVSSTGNPSIQTQRYPNQKKDGKNDGKPKDILLANSFENLQYAMASDNIQCEDMGLPFIPT